MKALVYHGPNQKEWESKPDPKLDRPSDAIVQVDTATICGTDLHILKGDVPTVTEGRTLGHEAVGTVVETGDAVEVKMSGQKATMIHRLEGAQQTDTGSTKQKQRPGSMRQTE